MSDCVVLVEYEYQYQFSAYNPSEYSPRKTKPIVAKYEIDRVSFPRELFSLFKRVASDVISTDIAAYNTLARAKIPIL